jgi:hypothetical protein
MHHDIPDQVAETAGVGPHVEEVEATGNVGSSGEHLAATPNVIIDTARPAKLDHRAFDPGVLGGTVKKLHRKREIRISDPRGHHQSVSTPI